MLINHTHERLVALGLAGMAKAFDDIAVTGPELLDLANADSLRDDAALRAPGCQVTTLRVQNLHRVVYIEAVQIGLQARVTQAAVTSGIRPSSPK